MRIIHLVSIVSLATIISLFSSLGSAQGADAKKKIANLDSQMERIQAIVSKTAKSGTLDEEGDALEQQMDQYVDQAVQAFDEAIKDTKTFVASKGKDGSTD